MILPKIFSVCKPEETLPVPLSELGFFPSVLWKSAGFQRNLPGDLGGMGRCTMKALVPPLDLSCSSSLVGRGLLYKMLLSSSATVSAFLQFGRASSLKYEEAGTSFLGAVFCPVFYVIFGFYRHLIFSSVGVRSCYVAGLPKWLEITLQRVLCTHSSQCGDDDFAL